MKPRTIGLISLLTMIGTILWLVLMIAGMTAAGPLDTFEQALAHAARQETTFTLSYLNAALITLLAMALMAGLYGYCKSVVPGWPSTAWPAGRENDANESWRRGTDGMSHRPSLTSSAAGGGQSRGLHQPTPSAIA